MPGTNAVFTNQEVSFGTSILFGGDTTWTLVATGTYRVSFDLQTSALTATPATVAVAVNGVVLNPQSTLSVPGAPLVGMVTFNALAGDVVNLVDAGSGVITLTAGSSATIDQIQ